MPFERPLGDVISPGSVQPRKVPSNPATKSAVPPIQVRRWVRNGTHPNASLESKKNEALNHAGLFRTKDYFNCVSHVQVRSPTTSADDLWRFAFRTGPLAHAVYVSCLMHSPHSDYFAKNSQAVLNLYTVPDESAVAQSATFTYGPGPTSGFTGAWAWRRLRALDQMLPVSPNQDYYALVRRVQGASIYSITAFELASMTERNGGYLTQSIGAQQPIVDAYRENQNALFEQLWEGTDPKVFHWTTYPSGVGWPSGTTGFPWTYKATTSTTAKNILDLTSTAVTANTPGWHPDMRNKNRRSQPSGVPCVMKAFGKYTRGASVNLTGGVVELKDSTGAVVASITGWGASPTWRSVAFNLPATHAKYDVHFRNVAGGETFDLFAVSVYPVG